MGGRGPIFKIDWDTTAVYIHPTIITKITTKQAKLATITSTKVTANKLTMTIAN